MEWNISLFLLLRKTGTRKDILDNVYYQRRKIKEFLKDGWVSPEIKWGILLDKFHCNSWEEWVWFDLVNLFQSLQALWCHLSYQLCNFEFCIYYVVIINFISLAQITHAHIHAHMLFISWLKKQHGNVSQKFVGAVIFDPCNIESG